MSDTANRIAERYGFWLGDAFASGGSNGYDHKALGHHRPRRVGVAQAPLPRARPRPADRRVHGRRRSATCPATCSATGCCCRTASGSSPPTTTATSSSTRTPMPDRGFAERKRLFELAGSSWDDYDRDAISEGGGVWPRSAKSIPLSPQIRAALGVEDEALAPTDVIRAILRAPVDVLWNGGIGTVVKASSETDADAHDRSSDAIRVDASDLALPRRRRGRQPRPHPARADRVRRRRRAHQRRLHRQLGRRRLLRPRGQPQDPAQRRGRPRRARRRGPRRPAARGHRRRRRPRPLRLVPAGPDPRAGGPRLGRADVRLRGPHGRARGGGAARPRHRVPAELGGDGRAPPREPRPRAARARRPARLRQARADRRARFARISRRSRSSARRCAATSRRSSSTASGTCSASTRCVASSWRRSSPTT